MAAADSGSPKDERAQVRGRGPIALFDVWFWSWFVLGNSFFVARLVVHFWLKKYYALLMRVGLTITDIHLPSRIDQSIDRME